MRDVDVVAATAPSPQAALSRPQLSTLERRRWIHRPSPWSLDGSPSGSRCILGSKLFHPSVITSRLSGSAIALNFLQDHQYPPPGDLPTLGEFLPTRIPAEFLGEVP
jgi:hypothetical protein